MGANSSKASNNSPTLDDSKAGVFDKDAVRQQPLHRGPIHCVCSVGETTIASGGADKEVVVLNWRDRYVEARLTGPDKDITKLCCNRTGSFIYAASRDRSIYVWKWPYSEPESGESCSGSHMKSTATLEGHSLGVSALDTSDAHPQLLCSGSRDNSVCLWDVDVGKPVSSMYVPRNLVTDLAWVPGEMAVAQASEDKTVRVWDLTSCSTVQHFKARNQLQLCCAVSEDQQYLLSGGSGCGPVGGQMTVWDRRNEKKPLVEVHAHHDGVYGCQFLATPSKSLACSVGGDSTVRVWEQDSLVEVCQGQLPDAGAITGLVSAQQDLLVCSSFSSGLSFWTLSSASEDASEDKSLNVKVKVTFTCS